MSDDARCKLAYSHYLKGRDLFRTYTRDGVAAAKREWSEAISLDPELSRAYGWLAYALLEEVQQGWASDVAENLDAALDLAKKGVATGPADYYAHWNLATVHLGRKEMPEAHEEFDKALALNPDEPDLLADVADMLSYEGKGGEAVELMMKAIKLKIPQWYYWSLGFAYFQQKHYAQAAEALEKMSDPPNTAYLLLVACRKKIGKPTAADAIMERLRNKDAQWTPEHLKRFPFDLKTDEAHYLSCLSDAGVPVPA